MPAYSGYFRMTRNGQDIPDYHYECMMGASFTESVFEGMEMRTTVNFSVAAALSNQVNVKDGEFLELMDDYIFGLNDSFTVYIGQDKDSSAEMMTGAIISVDANFEENGNITFAVVITNALVSDPSIIADENSPQGWATDTSPYQILNDLCAARNLKLNIPDSTVKSDLQLQKFSNGHVRPRGATTNSMLRNLASELGLHIQEDKRVVTVSKIYDVKPGNVYMRYRTGQVPVIDGVGGIGDGEDGTLFTFKPSWTPRGSSAASALGINKDTGQPVQGGGDSNPPKQPINNTHHFDKRNAGAGGTGLPGPIQQIQLPPIPPISTLLPDS